MALTMKSKHKIVFNFFKEKQCSFLDISFCNHFKDGFEWKLNLQKNDLISIYFQMSMYTEILHIMKTWQLSISTSPSTFMKHSLLGSQYNVDNKLIDSMFNVASLMKWNYILRNNQQPAKYFIIISFHSRQHRKLIFGMQPYFDLTRKTTSKKKWKTTSKKN